MTTGPTSVSRAAREDAREQHERALMEEILKQNENPFQRFGDAMTSSWSYVYNNYLYSSGVLLVGLCLWSVYPSYVRFRHIHIMRYRRTQLKFRRWFFATNHLPKWDKKYLQEVVVPPLTTSTKVSVDTLLSTHPSAAQGVAAATAAAPTVRKESDTNEVSLHNPATSSLSPADRDAAFSRTENLLSVKSLRGQACSKSTFSNGESRQSERQLNKALNAINQVYFNSEQHQFAPEYQISKDGQQLRADIEAAVKQSRSTIVLKETHDTVKSVPPGYEVWWLSADEARRTRFCKFWIGGLLFARVLQDLLDMPEMPDFVQ